MKKSNILNILSIEKKLVASNFYITAVNKVEPSKKIMSLFYSPVKKSSVKHGIADKSVALTVYVSLLTTQPVPINLIQPGLISSKSHPFLGASHIGGSGGRKRL